MDTPPSQAFVQEYQALCRKYQRTFRVTIVDDGLGHWDDMCGIVALDAEECELQNFLITMATDWTRYD